MQEGMFENNSDTLVLSTINLAILKESKKRDELAEKCFNDDGSVKSPTLYSEYVKANASLSFLFDLKRAQMDKTKSKIRTAIMEENL